tara:strand:+ start:1279 stop:2136 length:858 start_codon:yes stop_codon:yes gene_type:complete
MNYVITGSSSSIGLKLIKTISLNKKNFIYALYLKNKPCIYKKNIKYIKHELSKSTKKINLTADVLIHCATVVPQNTTKRNDFMSANFIGPKYLVERLLENNLKYIIFLSSMSVYEKNSKVIDENSTLTKDNYYAESKILFEKKLREISKKNNIKILILRLPGYLGKNSKYNFLSKVKKNILKKEPVFFQNPNAYFNNLIHEKTICSIIKKFINFDKRKFLILNLASKYPMKIINIIKLMYKLANKKENYIIDDIKTNSFIISTKFIIKCGYKINTTKEEILNFMK